MLLVVKRKKDKYIFDDVKISYHVEDCFGNFVSAPELVFSWVFQFLISNGQLVRSFVIQTLRFSDVLLRYHEK